MSEPLDSLLADPRIWRARQAGAAGDVLPSGHRDLDAALPEGGWPAAGLIEIATERWGTGELSLLAPLLARPGRRGRAPGWLAWISPPYVPYAPALAAAGIDVSRVLLVHGRSDAETLWAAEQALRSAGCERVLAWVGRAGMAQLRRLQLAASEGGLPMILFRPPRSLDTPSPARLRLRLEAGPDGRLAIVKSRGGRPASLPVRGLIGRSG